MKRRIMLKLVVFLLLGAIVNVAVAWGCAFWITLDRDGSRIGLSAADPPRWAFASFSSFGANRIFSSINDEKVVIWPNRIISYRQDEIASWSHVSNPPTAHELHGPSANVIEDARGWPRFSMLSTAIEVREQRTIVSGIELGAQTDPALEFRVLPVRPIVFGFAINAIFYSAILWLLFAAPGIPGKLRRCRRIKRGLCPDCGYPVGTLGGPVCTECGKPVTHMQL